MASPDSEPGTGRESGNSHSCHQMDWPFFRHVGRGATYPIQCRESRLLQVQQGTTGLKRYAIKKALSVPGGRPHAWAKRHNLRTGFRLWFELLWFALRINGDRLRHGMHPILSLFGWRQCDMRLCVEHTKRRTACHREALELKHAGRPVPACNSKLGMVELVGCLRDFSAGINQRSIHQVFAQEPGFELVASEYIADCHVICAVIA